MDDYGWDFSNENDWWTPTSDPQAISVLAGDMAGGNDYANYATDVNTGLEGYDGYQSLPPQLGGSNYTYEMPAMDYANNSPYMQSMVSGNVPQITGAIQTGQNTNLQQMGDKPAPFDLSQTIQQFKDKPISSTIDALGSKPGLALLGMGANLAGNYMNQQATQKGQQNYLNAVQWTPEKTENYMNALRNNVTSLYGNAAQGQNKAMSASNAARGKGGGTYGNQTQAVSREMRENMAKALNQGALTTNTPVNPGMGAYAQTSPVGQTLTGIGGDLASINNSSMQMDYLRKLGIIK